jgi:hypothetical protein
MTRRRAVLPLLALVALLALAAVAYAKTYDVPASLGSALDRTRAKTSLAILLPSKLALDYSGRTYASGGGGRTSYDLSLAGAPSCGGADACFLVSFSAKRGGAPDFRREVRLRGGRIGYFKPLSCGGSCSPPEIQWRSRGSLYTIQAKIPDSSDAAAQKRLVAAANSAIGAGPR